MGQKEETVNIEITFRHLEHTESIDDKIREKVNKLTKRHFSDNANLHWTSWVEHDEHFTTFRINDNGKEYFVKASADNLYKTIDMVIHKMEAQIGHKH